MKVYIHHLEIMRDIVVMGHVCLYEFHEISVVLVMLIVGMMNFVKSNCLYA